MHSFWSRRAANFPSKNICNVRKLKSKNMKPQKKYIYKNIKNITNINFLSKNICNARKLKFKNIKKIKITVSHPSQPKQVSCQYLPRNPNPTPVISCNHSWKLCCWWLIITITITIILVENDYNLIFGGESTLLQASQESRVLWM